MYRSQLLLKNSNFVSTNITKKSFQTSAFQQNNGGQSPIKVFVDTFRKEWNKSQELKDEVKALQSATGKMGESEAFQRAKEAYQNAQKGSGQVVKGIQKTAEVVGDVAHKAWESPVGQVTRSTIKTTAETVDKVIVEPVTKTKAYKEVTSVMGEGSSRYGSYEDKETRRLRRELELKNQKKPKAVKINDEAGTALVATDIKPTSNSMKSTIFGPNTKIGKILNVLAEKWNEAENPLLVLIRKIANAIGGFFAETESAQVIKSFREIDPSFNSEEFSKQLREYIVPEVLDAFIQGDEKILKMWLSEAPFNIIAAQQKQLREQGLFSDGRILDVRGVDIVKFKMLEPSNIPVLVIGARVQEINLYRKVKTGELAAGSEEDILLSAYAMVLTRIPEEVDNKETEGWKILEFVRGGSRSFT
ncbi:unnamed protein product [[Candida] boidinii]|nr:unnamed protein product [[Candida] boidinii]